MWGFKITKNLINNEKLFWHVFDNFNYDFINEDYNYCVARQFVKMIKDCKQYNIPYYVDLEKKLGDASVESVFDINKKENVEWWNIFEIKRNIKCVSKSELIKNYLKSDYFIKSLRKGFSTKNIIKSLNQIIYNSYGQCETYEEALNSLCYGFGNGSSNTLLHDKFLVSDLVDFNPANELRVVFVGNRIHSIASKTDYENSAVITKELLKKLKKIVNKYEYFSTIWNVDIDSKSLEIVEVHSYCEKLGFFYGNQNYNKLFNLIKLNKKYE